MPRSMPAAATLAALGLALALGACLVPAKAVIDGRVDAVPLRPHSRLAVQVCEQAIADCGNWLYPDATGHFQAGALDPGPYTVTVFIEMPSGLTPLTSVETVLAGGQVVTVELVVPALPSIPPA